MLRTAWYLAGSACVLSLGLGGCTTPNAGPRPASDRYETFPPKMEMARWSFPEAEKLVKAGHDVEALDELRKILRDCPEYMPAHLLYQRTAREQAGARIAFARDNGYATQHWLRVIAHDHLLRNEFEDALAAYAILGGMPAYLSRFRTDKTLEENVVAAAGTAAKAGAIATLSARAASDPPRRSCTCTIELILSSHYYY